MLNKIQKAKVVEELSDRFKKQKIAIFSDFRGVSVSKFQSLRRGLKKEDGEFKVTRKTLFDRALSLVGLDFSTKKLEGEIGVAFGYGDQVAPAKLLAKFSKDNETFKILGGILDGKILSQNDVIALSKLPPREALLGQVAGALLSPIRGLVTVLGGNMRNLVVVLNNIKDKK
jgi:large subunit ribosomal protein L10